MSTVAITTVADNSEQANNLAASSAASYACLSLLCGLLVFAVLAFGAIDVWSTSILEIGAMLLFMVWALSQAGSAEIRVRLSPLFAPMLAFGILVALQIAFGLTVVLVRGYSLISGRMSLLTDRATSGNAARTASATARSCAGLA